MHHHPWKLILVALALQVQGALLSSADQATPLSEEPLLRELFAGDTAHLQKLSSCMDSVFNLKRAYEVLYSVKSIYNDHLTSRTDKLTDAEQSLLLFCRDPLPIGGEAVAEYLKHPVNAHKFVNFVARQMNPKLLGLIGEHPAVKMLLHHLVANAGCWLNEASVAESVASLLTIRLFYNISVADFIAGNFGGRRPSSELTAAELAEILLHLNRHFDPVQVAEFADYLRRERLGDMQSLGEQPLRSLYRILGKAYYQTRQFDKAIEVLREYQARDASGSESANRGVTGDIAYIDANRRGDPMDIAAEATRAVISGLEREFGATSTPESRAAFQRYRRLCTGFGGDNVDGVAANQSANPLLVCENWRPHNGWYPIRKEILGVQPLVVRYVDAFAHWRNVTDALMKEAEKRIYEAPKEDFGATSKSNKLTQVRIHAFSEPLMPFNSNDTRSIIQRIEFLTGMDVTVHFASGEKYIEVANQGHGIRNRPHVTTKLPNMFYDGMATAVFFPYEDVIGGEEIFPDKSLKIPVKRSDLVVWYNYLPTFHMDQTALHCGCPILFGDKWTAKVTLGLTRCSLDQETMMEPWQAGRTLARRRSVARSWTVLPKPRSKLPDDYMMTNATRQNDHVVTNATISINATLGPQETKFNATDGSEEKILHEKVVSDSSDEVVEAADAVNADAKTAPTGEETN